ncbi:cell division ATP-binding protein FtsE [Liquorilactobacillus sicerae]|uniref:cell division ATP-binding protein FtsE n=1 Tax=Liquorilactobacillus sicerae TaxID=1416943 RepID=UPI0024800DB3|nr:ATP-binding cassette domain-containing protein [Liquorilactobacillus sicerae]
MIKFEHVSKVYSGGTQALKNISFKIEQGEFVFLVGSSGAGKTTTLKLMDKEESLTMGSIQMGNMFVQKIKPQQTYLLRRQIGVVRQKDIFIPKLTVFENLTYVLEALEFDEDQKSQRAIQVLKTVGMLAYKDNKINELSVGQQKKIAIARAIVNHPFVLLADEPTANLDPKSAMEIMKLFFKLNMNQTTVIMATHDSTIVNTLRHRVIELQQGKLIRDEKNGTYSIFSDPKDVYIW